MTYCRLAGAGERWDRVGLVVESGTGSGHGGGRGHAVEAEAQQT